MSDTTQNNRPEQEKKTQQNGQAHRNRHRPHHHKGNRPPRTERPEAVADAASDVTEPKVRPQNDTNRNTAGSEQGASQNAGNKKHNRQNQDKPAQNDRRSNRDGERRRNRGQSRSSERRPYDPYEKPSREEIELSELRAQIVLKSADGSVPTAYSASSTPTQASAVSEPTAEVTPAAEMEGTPDVTAVQVSDQPSEEAAPDLSQKKVEVVGVRFRSSGKMYYFDPQSIKAQKGDFAIVETTRGPEFGEICLANTMIAISETVAPLRPLLRIATEADIAHNAENREKEKNALTVCQEKIRAHGLEMKLIDVQYAFDNSKLLFYFSAEGRVDFRELVKDLASVFRTRIELRQIGIRDEAKLLGGIGACGRALCCSTFLPDFAQVSIKMAKEQNLSLNSSKISGVCGRLMCCLRYESEVYAEEIRKTPSNDSLVRTEDGIGTVISSNPLAGTIRVILKDSPDTPPKQYHRDSVTVLPRERRGGAERKDAEKAEKAEENN